MRTNRTEYYVARDGMRWALCSRTWTDSGWRLSLRGTFNTRSEAREARRETMAMDAAWEEEMAEYWRLCEQEARRGSS